MAVRDDRQVDADEPGDVRRVHAGCVDDDLAFDAALVGLDGVDAAVSRLDAGDASCASRSRRRAGARRRRARTSAGSGRGSRRAGMNAAATTPSVDISGKSSCASARATRSPCGSPKVLAHAAWRRSSSSRAGATTRAAGRRARASPGSLPVSRAQLGVEADRVLHHPRQRERTSAAARRARPSATSSRA